MMCRGKQFIGDLRDLVYESWLELFGRATPSDP
jgi:hypothetical protein